MGVAKEIVDGFRASRGSAATGVEEGADDQNVIAAEWLTSPTVCGS